MKRPFIGDYKVKIEDYEKIKSLMNEGRKFAAIKWFRSIIFCDLKQAKQAIEEEFQRSE